MDTFSNSVATPAELPSVEDIEFIELHPSYRWINQSDPLVFFVLGAVLIFGLSLLPKLNFNPWPILAIYVPLMLVVLTIRFCQSKACGYALREQDLLFHSGLWWHKTTAVAFSRVQHIDMTHGPLERKYQMATLKLFTAGGSSADLKVPGLPEEDARRIRAHILAKAGRPQEDEDKDATDAGQ